MVPLRSWKRKRFADIVPGDIVHGWTTPASDDVTEWAWFIELYETL